MRHGEVVVALERDDLARIVQPVPELLHQLGLARIFRRLDVARHEHQGCAHGIVLMHRAVAPRLRLVHADLLVQIAEPDRLEVVDARNRAAALCQINRQIGAERRPVRRQHQGRKVAAGGLARDMNLRRIAAERTRIAPHPGERRAVLPHDLVHANGRRERIVDHDGRNAVRPEPLGHEAVMALVERVPVAAMDEDLDRRIGLLGGEDIERLPRR